jgi:hypothetical protein
LKPTVRVKGDDFAKALRNVSWATALTISSRLCRARRAISSQTACASAAGPGARTDRPTAEARAGVLALSAPVPPQPFLRAHPPVLPDHTDTR